MSGGFEQSEISHICLFNLFVWISIESSAWPHSANTSNQARLPCSGSALMLPSSGCLPIYINTNPEQSLPLIFCLLDFVYYTLAIYFSYREKLAITSDLRQMLPSPAMPFCSDLYWFMIIVFSDCSLFSLVISIVLIDAHQVIGCWAVVGFIIL